MEQQEDAPVRCPVIRTLNIISGKWKARILFVLMDGPCRFNELRRLLPGVTQRMLTSQLRALQADDLVIRDVKDQVPPHVEYSLSEKGKAMAPVFLAMEAWGDENLPPIQDVAQAESSGRS